MYLLSNKKILKVKVTTQYSFMKRNYICDNDKDIINNMKKKKLNDNYIKKDNMLLLLYGFI
tara:strand:- start:4861 stop:5043 length:183 start_codon:yes stop_codon:yes gene_type:complete